MNESLRTEIKGRLAEYQHDKENAVLYVSSRYGRDGVAKEEIVALAKEVWPATEPDEEETAVTVVQPVAFVPKTSEPAGFVEYKKHIEAIFEPNDTICFVAIETGKGAPYHDFLFAKDALTLDYFNQLLKRNETASIYLAMNAYKPELRGQRIGRTKENILTIRSLYADADVNGRESVDKIESSKLVPVPPIVLESSPGKFQTIWPVEGIDAQSAESLLKSIAKEFATDEAVAEIARILRVPGFRNRKYPEAPMVVVGRCVTSRFRCEDFKLVNEKVDAKEDALHDAPRDTAGLVPHGHIHNYMLTQAGKLRQQGLSVEAIEVALLDLVHKNCAPPIDETRVRTMARSICNFPAGENKDLILTQEQTAQTPTPPLQEYVERYAMSEEDIEKELEKDYPVIPLLPQPGPTWDDDIMHGIAGEIIRRIGASCEAHPAGMYLDLLVSVGNIIGRGPYFNIGHSRHYTNEFMARVGPTSSSRKGTGRDAVDDILTILDSEWVTKRTLSGFGSGEAVIDQVRDSMQQQVRDKKSPTGFQTVLVRGIDDKRLCIREGELASVFLLAAKKESRADIILRDGWDGKPLRNLVKGKSREGFSNSATCQEPQISISGDTTRAELVAKMPKGSDENGFGNRFLYVYVYRVKSCANGGPQIDWSDIVPRLHEAILFARDVRYVPLTKAGTKMWNRLYMGLEGERLFGLAGLMTARDAAHIRRLALIFALLDDQDMVDSCHLQAAKKLWDYCQESAKYIFTGTTADQDKIVSWVRSQNLVGTPVKGTDITQKLFQKHKTSEWVRNQVTALVTARLLIETNGLFTAAN